MTVILAGMGDWADEWAPPEFVGGLRHRSANELHERLHQAIEAAKAGRYKVFGAQLDLSKAFDRVKPEHAFRVWEALGAPKGVVHILRDYYRKRRTQLEWKGALASEILSPVLSLLQGCPASPMLLAGLMTLWHVNVIKDEAQVGVYADDRGIWTEGDRAATTLNEVCRRSKHFLSLIHI